MPVDQVTTQEVQYTSVLLDGTRTGDALAEVRASLELCGLSVDGTNATNLILRDVPERQLPNIHTVAASYGMRVVGIYGQKVVQRRVEASVRKAFRLNLAPKHWYVTDQAEISFPFIFISDIQIKRDAMGNEDEELTLECYRPDMSLPIQQVLSSRDVAKFGLRAMTEQDLKDADMITPVSNAFRLQESLFPEHVPGAINPGNSGIPGQHTDTFKPIPGQLDQGGRS